MHLILPYNSYLWDRRSQLVQLRAIPMDSSSLQYKCKLSLQFKYQSYPHLDILCLVDITMEIQIQLVCIDRFMFDLRLYLELLKNTELYSSNRLNNRLLVTTILLLHSIYLQGKKHKKL